MNFDEVTRLAIQPAMDLLPKVMDSARARVMLLTIGMQESRFLYRRQMGNGPARGFWQFERGTQASRGGVWGVCLHKESREHLKRLCVARGFNFDPETIWAAIEHDDVLAAGVARLLLWTDAQPLPAVNDMEGAWKLYADRAWRPGKPHKKTWPEFHALARKFVTGE